MMKSYNSTKVAIFLAVFGLVGCTPEQKTPETTESGAQSPAAETLNKYEAYTLLMAI